MRLVMHDGETHALMRVDELLQFRLLERGQVAGQADLVISITP